MLRELREKKAEEQTLTMKLQDLKEKFMKIDREYEDLKEKPSHTENASISRSERLRQTYTQHL